jgi:hypothetical protein
MEELVQELADQAPLAVSGKLVASEPVQTVSRVFGCQPVPARTKSVESGFSRTPDDVLQSRH